MVQEVQTAVTFQNETTLETIEAVGTSSRKIIEWRQTIWWHNISRCEAWGNVGYRYISGTTPKQSDYIESTDLAITSSVGDYEFSMVGNGIRLPVKWWYQFDVSRGLSTIPRTANFYLYVGDVLAYTDIITNNGTKTTTFQINAWKFDLVTIWADFNYWGSSGTAWITLNPAAQLRIQLL